QPLFRLSSTSVSRAGRRIAKDPKIHSHLLQGKAQETESWTIRVSVSALDPAPASVTKPVQGTVSGWEMVQVLTSEKRQMVPPQLGTRNSTIPDYPVVPRCLRPPAEFECSRFH